MHLRTLLPFALASLALGVLAAGATASSPPTASLDVIASSESSGPPQWRIWHVVASEPMRTVALALPWQAVRPDALRALMSMPQPPGGLQAGTVTAAIRRESDFIAVGTVPLQAGGCSGPVGDVATLRFQLDGACTNLAVDEAHAGVVVRADLGAAGVTALDVRLDAMQTTAGRLLPANPSEPVAADASATVDTASGTAKGDVREIVGGDTSLTVAASASRVVYGQTLTLSGQVRRGGVLAAGERIGVGAHYEPLANAPFDAKTLGVADAGGRFSVRVRPTSSARWAAWARPEASEASAPGLNTLAGLTSPEVVVRAPKPTIERRNASLVRGQLARAEIVVRNPIAQLETLQCRLYVGGVLTAVRRFPTRGGPLAFNVEGRPATRVRAVIGRWRGPRIAGRSSRVLTLLPTTPRRP